MPSKTRIGLIGLSTGSEGTNWAAQAHLPYLQSAQGKEHYEIVALCNSSVSSAQKSIEQYNLPSSITKYDSPHDLANDANVDLVVCVVGVERHYELILPAIEAGKNVYTELPLASDMGKMQELVKKAEEKGIKTVFGMQGQTSPVIKLLKNMVAEGKIGRVLSTSWTGAAGPLGEKPMPVGLKYTTKRETGGNFTTVWFLHTFNYIIEVLGELDAFSSVLGNQRTSIDLMDPKQDGKKVGTTQKDTPDQILLQGRFQSGALVSYHLRGGEAFPDTPGVTWSIYGEKGEIMITNSMPMLDIVHHGIKIKLQQFGQEVQEVEVPKDWMSDIQHPAQNVGRIYEAFAKGEEGSYPDWKIAMKRHELIDELWRRADGEKPFGEKAQYLGKA